MPILTECAYTQGSGVVDQESKLRFHFRTRQTELPARRRFNASVQDSRKPCWSLLRSSFGGWVGCL